MTPKEEAQLISDKYSGGRFNDAQGDLAKDIAAALEAKDREIERLRADRDHWKANHDNQVALKAAIMQRPDLKERVELVAALVRERDQLRQEVERLKRQPRVPPSLG